MNSYFRVLFVPITVYTIYLKKTTLCSKCPCDLEAIVLIHPGIKATSPESLLFFEIFIRISNRYSLETCNVSY